MSRRSARKTRQPGNGEGPPQGDPAHVPGSIFGALGLRVWVSLAAVGLVAVAACLAGFANEFTQDDAAIILDSTRLHGFSEWRTMLGEPYWPLPAAPDLYRPVTSLMLAAQYVVGDGSPSVFRVVSFALHAAASIAVLMLALRVLPWTIALGVSLLFAAHPVHVEATALAVAQNEILVTLLACVMVSRYLDRRRSHEHQGLLTWRDWTLLAVCYAIGAFAKEQGLLLPGFLLLAELCFAPPSRQRFREVWKGYAVLLVVGALALAARTAVLDGAVGPTMIAEALRGQTLGGRTLTMLKVVPEWIRLLVWPAHLRAEYSPREFVASTSFGRPEMLGLALVVGAIVVAWVSRRRARPVTFGILWCALALLPVSNIFIPTGILIAERTLFLASAGFVLAMGGAVARVALRWSTRPRGIREGLVAVTAILVIAGVIRSASRQKIWHDVETLTLTSLRDSPRSWRVRQSYAEMMFETGRPRDGFIAYYEAIDLAPERWRARNNLARRLRMLGADSAALAQLRQSLAEHPGEMETVAQMPPTLIALGRYEEARRLADSIIMVADAPMVMQWLRHVADSALAVKAPRGSIRIGIGAR